jgi:hypothetical protein
MKLIGPILLSTLATFTACSDAAQTGPNGERADEVAAGDVPVLAAQYGAVISTTMQLCQNDASPCAADDLLEVSGTMRGLMAMTQEGSQVHGDFVGCNVKLNWNGEDYDSDEYLKLERLGTLLKFDGGFVAGESAPVLQSDLAAVLIGAELSDDVGEDFPTDDRDARAFDQDGDGDPGISVKAPIGRIFLGARVVVDFDLAGTDEGVYLGSMRGHGFDVSVYDDTIPFVDAGKKVRNALDPVTMIDQGHSVELYPGTADCAAVMQL